MRDSTWLQIQKQTTLETHSVRLIVIYEHGTAMVSPIYEQGTATK